MDRSRLQAFVDGLFGRARQIQQDAKLEKKGSERKPAEQMTHRLDWVVDVLCVEFNLQNPGTDGQSVKLWGHPVDGYTAEDFERRRRVGVQWSFEKGIPSDAEWLRPLGLCLNKSGWVRKLKTRDADEPDTDDFA